MAGHDGLDRVVERANVMEVPDIAAWVKPQELLLTTGYPLRDTPGGMASLVTNLDSLGVSAIAVKLRRYLDRAARRHARGGRRRRTARSCCCLTTRPSTTCSTRWSRRFCSASRPSWYAATPSTSDWCRWSCTAAGSTSWSPRSTTASAGHRALVTTTDGRVLRGSARTSPDAQSRPELFVESGRFRSERFAPGLHALRDGSMAVVAVMAGRADHGRLVVIRDERNPRAG